MQSLIIKPLIVKIDQSKVKLTTKSIHESMQEARNKALDGIESFIFDGSGNVYRYYPTSKKSDYFPNSPHGYGLQKYYVPTAENIALGYVCYTWL